MKKDEPKYWTKTYVNALRRKNKEQGLKYYLELEAIAKTTEVIQLKQQAKEAEATHIALIAERKSAVTVLENNIAQLNAELLRVNREYAERIAPLKERSIGCAEALRVEIDRRRSVIANKYLPYLNKPE